MAPDPIILDTRELAERLDVDYAVVLRWAKLGRIPAIRVGNRNVFNLAAVVRALRRETVPEPAEVAVDRLAAELKREAPSCV